MGKTTSRIGKLSLGIIALTLSAGSACASIIDQQNTVLDGYLGPSSAAGQSFTPTLAGIDFASFELATSDGVNGASVFAVLYQGDGFGGSAIAASSNSVSVFNDSSFEEYTFDFAPTVVLTPGAFYTLQLLDVTGQTLFEGESSGNPYTGGVEYDSSAIAQTNYDLAFSEGVQSSPAPEPATIWAMSAGLALLGGLARRRRESR